jgi:hypothetical protein
MSELERQINQTVDDAMSIRGSGRWQSDNNDKACSELKSLFVDLTTTYVLRKKKLETIPNAPTTQARRLSHRAGTTPGQLANMMARFAYNFDSNIAIYTF